MQRKNITGFNLFSSSSSRKRPLEVVSTATKSGLPVPAVLSEPEPKRRAVYLPQDSEEKKKGELKEDPIEEEEEKDNRTQVQDQEEPSLSQYMEAEKQALAKIFTSSADKHKDEPVGDPVPEVLVSLSDDEEDIPAGQPAAATTTISAAETTSAVAAEPEIQVQEKEHDPHLTERVCVDCWKSWAAVYTAMPCGHVLLCHKCYGARISANAEHDGKCDKCHSQVFYFVKINL